MQRMVVSASICVMMAACLVSNPSSVVEPLPEDCGYGRITPDHLVPMCLAARGILSKTDRDSADKVIAQVLALRDSFRLDTTQVSFGKASELTRALDHVASFYSRRLFEDSARFHRMVDHLLVSEEYVRGTTLRFFAGRIWPRTTPWLSWQYYPNNGIYFQPVNTMQVLIYIYPKATTPTDSILGMAEHIHDYALWRRPSGHPAFPVWEYDFPFNSGGVLVDAPWLSSMAQALALQLYTEAYHRTGNQLWRDRAYEVFNSFKVSWNDGGVMLPDTSHGYWWEEFHPTVQIWNGSVVALVSVGIFADVMNDAEAHRMFQSGVGAVKYYTPSYDTGKWTLYSRTQGYNSIAYHQLCIKLMDQLYAMTQDPYFKTVADQWRAYSPPPGVS